MAEPTIHSVMADILFPTTSRKMKGEWQAQSATFSVPHYKGLTQWRLDIQHHLWALTLEGKLGLSPPHEKGASPERVLDVGTGTGSWAMWGWHLPAGAIPVQLKLTGDACSDFADEHPNSQVIGIDLSPIQPQE